MLLVVDDNCSYSMSLTYCIKLIIIFPDEKFKRDIIDNTKYYAKIFHQSQLT